MESGCGSRSRPRDSRHCCLNRENGAWDWSHTSKLVIPVDNPGGEPLTLLLRIADDAGRSLSGKISIAPGGAGDLALWIAAPSPRRMGMIAGPSLAAAGIEPHTLPVTATEGSVDASRVASVRLGIARPTAPREIGRRPAARRTAERSRQDGLSGDRRWLRPVQPRQLARKGQLDRDAPRQGRQGSAGSRLLARPSAGARPLRRIDVGS